MELTVLGGAAPPEGPTGRTAEEAFWKESMKP
jgi:hypothetical protein